MGAIHILPELIQNQIAAGEVVERPASIVKELVENSLDAGTSEIRVSVTEGGHGSIRVQDNGSGMDEADLLLATTRYATSKLFTVEDLHAIANYGFRGEALASIASVAKVRIKSRMADHTEGKELIITGGERSTLVPCACPEGTIITIEDLFFNTPARKKFLKTPQTEFGHISQLLFRYALLDYQRSYLLSHNGNTVLDVHATDSPRTRMIHMLGQDCAVLHDVSFEAPGLQITGFASPAAHQSHSNKHVYLFVNNRPISSPMLLKALREAYDRVLPAGKYPTVMLNITLTPDLVDVNVHPRKTEVKFTNEQQTFKAVLQALRTPLEATATHSPFTALPPVMRPVHTPARRTPTPNAGVRASSPYSLKKMQAPRLQQQFTLDTSSPAPSSPAPLEVQVIGQLHRSYILINTEEGYAILDQHAAHERVLFERLRASLKEQRSVSQTLAVPATLHLNLSEHSFFMEETSALEAVGFSFSDLGGGSVGVTAVPDIIAGDDLETHIRSIIDDMQAHVPLETTLTRTQDRLLAYASCKGAVKFGDVMSHGEMQQLVDDFFATPLRYTCPHGRPSIREYSLDELATLFKRPL